LGIHCVNETKNQVGKDPCRYISLEEPQDSGVYYYQVVPVCLIKNLGGSGADNSSTISETTYSGIEDNKTSCGFLLDGFPVYDPEGDNHNNYSGQVLIHKMVLPIDT